MRVVRWISLMPWVASWILMVLEVFRWHHLTPTLRFNRPPPHPSYGPGRLGGPARACAFVAPVVCVATVVSSLAVVAPAAALGNVAMTSYDGALRRAAIRAGDDRGQCRPARARAVLMRFPVYGDAEPEPPADACVPQLMVFLDTWRG